MLFNSVIFLTVFLPLALVGWYFLQRLENPAYAKGFLIGMSLWFYGYYNVYYLWILLASMLFNYGLSVLLERCGHSSGRKWLLGVGITGNLGLLFYFKYFNFFIDNCNYLLHVDINIEKIALPLGISFFTFQQLSYVIERYKKNVEHTGILDYGCFISFFPQLIAGPIVLYQEFVPQLQERKMRKPTAKVLYNGATLFILGLAKKVLLADTLAILVNVEFQNINYLDAPSAWATILFYVFELYFDFSGYCDMARGIGGMFGFELPENFNAPLHATSVKDFWRRWHMTLSRFLSSYIYIPLGGNRKGKVRQCVNLFIVFLVSGIWHGANWTFIVWGCMHGLAMVFETIFPKLRFKSDKLNCLLTNFFLTLAWVVFRCDSLEQAFVFWKKLFAGGMTGMFFGVCNVLQFPENYVLRKVLDMLAPQYLNIFYVLNFLGLLLICIVLVRGKKAEEWIQTKGQSAKGAFCMATLFVWSFISLSQVSTFLYFNF